MIENNEISLSGIFAEGYGIIPKKLMKMKLGMIKVQTKTKTINVKGVNIKAVLAYMLSYSGSGNQCFPGVKTIAEDLEISTDTVVYAIQGACQLGMISKDKLYPNNPLNHANKYTLEFLGDNPNYVTRKSRTTTSDGSTFQVVTVEKNNNSINNNNNNNNIKRERFTIPSIQEIENFAKEEGIPIDAESFYYYYDSVDWKTSGGKKMTKWKSAYKGWIKRQENWNKRKNAAGFSTMTEEEFLGSK